MKWNLDELARIFEYGLCIPPARTGLRLKSEPELARMLEINRMLIRSMLSDFVERDILLRRHGSGTYLRKLPGRSKQATEGVDMDWAVVVLKKGIFARPEAPLLWRRIRSDQRSLNLALLADHYFENKSPSGTCRSMFLGLQQRAEEAGRSLQMILLASEDFDPDVAADLTRKIRENSCDTGQTLAAGNPR